MDTVTLRERVLSEMDLSREYEDEEVLELIDKVIVAYGRESYLSLSAREVIRRERKRASTAERATSSKLM